MKMMNMNQNNKIRVGINGFGRIGRLALRAALIKKDIQIVAINDLADINHLAYLLKYDSTHGRLNAKIKIVGNDLFVNDQKIRITKALEEEGLEDTAIENLQNELVIANTTINQIKKRNPLVDRVLGSTAVVKELLDVILPSYDKMFIKDEETGDNVLKYPKTPEGQAKKCFQEFTDRYGRLQVSDGSGFQVLSSLRVWIVGCTRLL